MTNDEAFGLIKEALEQVSPGSAARVSEDSHLSEDEILDSLDLMNFLFELEHLNGGKIEAIDESYEDFRVSSLIKLLTSQ